VPQSNLIAGLNPEPLSFLALIMPGPGRGKAKSTKVAKPQSTRPVQSTPSAIPDPFIREIDDAEGWSNVVNMMCDFFELPGKRARL
jgi:hypothetical protein